MNDFAMRVPQASRLNALVWPREHGAWGILLVPLATGAAVGLMSGGRPGPLLPLTVAVLALFCLRTPVESLLGTTPMRAQTDAERRVVALVILLFSAIAVVALSSLLWSGENQGLLALGGVAALLFVVQSLLRRLGRDARMAAQLTGALGLTSTAAAAYYSATGQFDTRAIALWLANWIFAGNQVHFVQVRLHGARLAGFEQKFAQASNFFFGQVVMLSALAAAWRVGYLPALALLAFLPLFLRGTLWFFRGPETLRVHRLGLTELSHAVAFGLLLIASFYF